MDAPLTRHSGGRSWWMLLVDAPPTCATSVFVSKQGLVHVFTGGHHVYFLHGAPGSRPAILQRLLPEGQPRLPADLRMGQDKTPSVKNLGCNTIGAGLAWLMSPTAAVPRGLIESP
eukprot:1147844-Pelagomonas_calceolata.AAC.3